MKAAEMTVQDYRVEQAVKETIQARAQGHLTVPWLRGMFQALYEEAFQDGQEAPRKQP